MWLWAATSRPKIRLPRGSHYQALFVAFIGPDVRCYLYKQGDGRLSPAECLCSRRHLGDSSNVPRSLSLSPFPLFFSLLLSLFRLPSPPLFSSVLPALFPFFFLFHFSTLLPLFPLSFPPLFLLSYSPLPPSSPLPLTPNSPPELSLQLPPPFTFPSLSPSSP